MVCPPSESRVVLFIPHTTFSTHFTFFVLLWMFRHSTLSKYFPRRMSSLPAGTSLPLPLPTWSTEYPNLPVLPNETQFLQCLKNLTKDSITNLGPSGANVSVIQLPKALSSSQLYSDLLFVRDFYPSLLEDLRKSRRSILVGNPGTSKSFFQFYYLARIFNPLVFGSLPKDSFGSTDPPDVVVRQICGFHLEIYQQSSDQVHEIIPDSRVIFRYLDKEKSLYLMEPEVTKREPYPTEIPTLITVSPDTSRYKEFAKNGGVAYYMPCYTQDELVAIGKYLRENNRVPEGMENKYQEDAIKKRFYKYGGIIRHVLPQDQYQLDETEAAQSQAISDVASQIGIGRILTSSTLEDPQVSHFIAQYEVPRETKGKKIRFKRPPLNFVSEGVADQLRDSISRVSSEVAIKTLIRNDETGFMSHLCPLLYENLLYDLITSAKGLKCQRRMLKLDSDETSKVKDRKRSQSDGWVDYELKLDSAIRGSSPPYSEMAINTLYYPTKVNFPMAEFFYKKEDGTLVAFQVTRQNKPPKLITQFVVDKFLGEVKFPKDQISTKLELVLIPSPIRADQMYFKQDKRKKGNLLIKDYTILKIDPAYDRMIGGVR
jgi:hypothetical protein